MPRGGKKARRIDETIGSRLKTLRVSKGITQTELGNLLGMTFQQVQKYENGTNALRPRLILTACAVLDATPEDLLGWEKNQSPKELGWYEKAVVAHGDNAVTLVRSIAGLHHDIVLALAKVADAMSRREK